MLRNVLQPELSRALLAVDLWTFVARIGPPQLCQQHCHVLASLITSLPTRSENPSYLHLQLLLYRLVKLLDEQYQVLCNTFTKKDVALKSECCSSFFIFRKILSSPFLSCRTHTCGHSFLSMHLTRRSLTCL